MAGRRDSLQHQREPAIGELAARARRRAARNEQRERVCVQSVLTGTHLDPAREPSSHRISLPRVLDGGGKVARERQPAVLFMRSAPARHRARNGQRSGKEAAQRDFVHAARAEPVDACAPCGTPAAVQVAHAACFCVVDQPERVAADAGHVRVEHGKRGARRDRGVHRRASGAKRVDSRRGGERVRRNDHAPGRYRRRPASVNGEHWTFSVAAGRPAGASPPPCASPRRASRKRARNASRQCAGSCRESRRSPRWSCPLQPIAGLRARAG